MGKSSRGRPFVLAAAVAASMLGFVLAEGREAPDTARLPLLARADFESGRADGWNPRDPAHWRVMGMPGERAYELTAPGTQGRLRAPASWSLWEGFDVSSFEFSGRLRSTADPANPLRDICIFFHFVDPAHFAYVHFAAKSDEVHNIIGLVDGADRVKINREPAGASVFRLTGRDWHSFKVTCDAETGEIRAYLDDMDRPILTACDRTISHGLVGVGSFDDTGAFAGLELRGSTRPQSPVIRHRTSVISHQ